GGDQRGPERGRPHRAGGSELALGGRGARARGRGGRGRAPALSRRDEMIASSMPFSEALRSALDNLSSHKLRSALTMLGMMFGVGAVIAMLSIGAGAERQALAIIDRMGLRNIVV